MCLAYQQDGAGSVIEDKASDMPDRFWTAGRFANQRGARADDDEVGIPFGGALHNLAFRSPVSLQAFRAGQVAQAFVEDILRGGDLGLAHLFLSGPGWMRAAQKPLAVQRQLFLRATIDHVKERDGE